MKTPKNAAAACPVEDTFNIIGHKWSILIIRDLLGGKKRFSELQRSLTGISPRSLAARLVELQSHLILRKKTYPVVPPHTEYTLTEHGEALGKVLDQVVLWNREYRKKCLR